MATPFLTQNFSVRNDLNLDSLRVTGDMFVGGNLTVEGSISPGTFTNRVVSLTTTPQVLTAAQSGTTFVLNRAAGIVVTLPTAAVGLNYEFVVGVDNTLTTVAGATTDENYQGTLLNIPGSSRTFAVAALSSHAAFNIPVAAGTDNTLTLYTCSEWWSCWWCFQRFMCP